MEFAIRVSGLTKEYPEFTLSEVSFDLHRGTVMGYIGRNGAGKTTTINLMMGLIQKDSGSINILGEETGKDNANIREKIGFVYDEPGFFAGMAVRDIGKITSPYYRNWSSDEFHRLIEKFGLNPKQKTGKLSRGQKMKLGLALALSHDAELLIMDEPTSGLDPVFRDEFTDLLYKFIQDERRSVFFSTHITSDLESVADYITYIDDGKIVLTESKDTLLNKYKIVKGPLESLDDPGRKMCVGIRETQSGFEALSSSAGDLAALVGKNAVVEKAKLEDIMVYSAKGAGNGR